MVVFTGVAVATVLTGGAAAGAGAAIGLGSGATGAAVGTGSAVATAAGIGVSGGAIAGAAATSTATGAVVGAAAGGAAGAGVGGAGAGLGAFAIGTGGLGLLAVGTSESTDGSSVTYDCWKPIVHDTSEEPSNGMPLKDVVKHPNVSKVTVTGQSEYPKVVLENIWNERFEIEYVMFIETGEVACHARQIFGFE